MPGRDLQAQVRSYQPRAVIIEMHGEINSRAEQTLNDAFTEAEKQQTKAILLNFSDVDYINSTGIALIVALLSRARALQCQFIVYGLSEHYIEIFHITRLVDFLAIFPDEASALASVEKGA